MNFVIRNHCLLCFYIDERTTYLNCARKNLIYGQIYTILCSCIKIFTNYVRTILPFLPSYYVGTYADYAIKQKSVSN